VLLRLIRLRGITLARLIVIEIKSDATTEGCIIGFRGPMAPALLVGWGRKRCGQVTRTIERVSTRHTEYSDMYSKGLKGGC